MSIDTTFRPRAYDDFAPMLEVRLPCPEAATLGGHPARAATAQGASRSTWAELEGALGTNRFRWVRLAAPAIHGDRERSRT